MKMFVPEPLANKPIKIIANENEIDEIVSEKQRRMTKSVIIPADIIPTSRLKIEIRSEIWNPNEIDQNLDSKPLSLAFDYLELYAIND